MKRRLQTWLVIALDRGCCAAHWLPGLGCRLADWSFRLDRRWHTGQWRNVSGECDWP